MAQFTITINQQTNLPPSQVGDGARTTEYGTSVTFTRQDFTTNTVPPYQDPEGDAALNLKIITLPVEGDLLLNSSPIIVNQIISFADIDSGLFTYSPNNGNTSLYNDPFQFEISDAGSNTFVG